MRGRHASAGRTALYHVVQGRPATSRDGKAIGITEAQRNRKGGPRHVSVHCEEVGGRYGSGIGGTSTGRYVNTFFGIRILVTNHECTRESYTSSNFREQTRCIDGETSEIIKREIIGALQYGIQRNLLATFDY